MVAKDRVLNPFKKQKLRKYPLDSYTFLFEHSNAFYELAMRLDSPDFPWELY